MKAFLILLNVLLAGAVVVGAVSMLKTPKQEIVVAAGRDRSKAKPKTEPRKAAPPAPMEAERAVRTVIAQNIFNVDRCPEAVAGRGGGGSQMMLIGVYDIGPQRGAIIEQRRQTTRRNAFREMQSMVRGGRGRVAGDTTVTTLPLQKFFRVGDTLDNGYTLTAVGADHAVLSRGSSTTTLQLELAGRSINARSTATRQPNAQQVQQMMMMGQLRMMQMMQQQIQQNTTNTRGGATPNRPAAAGTAGGGGARQR